MKNLYYFREEALRAAEAAAQSSGEEIEKGIADIGYFDRIGERAEKELEPACGECSCFVVGSDYFAFWSSEEEEREREREDERDSYFAGIEDFWQWMNSELDRRIYKFNPDWDADKWYSYRDDCQRLLAVAEEFLDYCEKHIAENYWEKRYFKDEAKKIKRFAGDLEDILDGDFGEDYE